MRAVSIAVAFTLSVVACGGEPQTPPESPHADVAHETTDASSASSLAVQPPIDAVTSPDAAPPPVAAAPPPKIERCTVGAFDANKGCVAASPLELPDPFRDKTSPELEKILSKKKTGKDAQDVQNVIDSVQAATTLARRAKGTNAKINWYVRAVTAFEKVSFNLVGIPKVTLDMAAEAAYSLVTLEMEQSFADETKEKCPGKTLADVFGEGQIKPGRFQALAENARGYADRFDAVPKKYQSDLWAAIAMARTGILYARLRASLDACGDANENASGASDAFRDRKRTELEALDELAWKRLTTGIVLANAYGISTDVIALARASLRKLVTAIGDDRARAFAEKTQDPFDPDRTRTLAKFAASLPAPP
jgi:hypothetical protein